MVDSGAFGFAIFVENFVSAALGRTSNIEGFSATFDADASSAKENALGRVEIEANDDWEGSRVPLLQRVPLQGRGVSSMRRSASSSSPRWAIASFS